MALLYAFRSLALLAGSRNWPEKWRFLSPSFLCMVESYHLFFLPQRPHFSTKVAIYRQERVAYCAPPPSCALSLSLSLSLSLLSASLSCARARDLAHQFANITPTHCVKSRDCSTRLLNFHMYRRESGIHLFFLFLLFSGSNAPNAAPMLCLFVCRCCCAFFCDAVVLDCSIEWIGEEWVDSQVFQWVQGVVGKKSFVSILQLCCYVLLCKTSFRLWWCICDAPPLLLLLHSRTHLREQTSWSSRLEHSCIKDKLSHYWFQVCVFFLSFCRRKKPKKKEFQKKLPLQSACYVCWKRICWRRNC